MCNSHALTKESGLQTTAVPNTQITPALSFFKAKISRERYLNYVQYCSGPDFPDMLL